jgi:hypothetical protein
MTTQDKQFKDLFIAKCVQIPQADQKAACPEQLRLISNRHYLGSEPALHVPWPTSSIWIKKLNQLGLKQPEKELQDQG